MLDAYAGSGQEQAGSEALQRVHQLARPPGASSCAKVAVQAGGVWTNSRKPTSVSFIRSLLFSVVVLHRPTMTPGPP